MTLQELRASAPTTERSALSDGRKVIRVEVTTQRLKRQDLCKCKGQKEEMAK